MAHRYFVKPPKQARRGEDHRLVELRVEVAEKFISKIEGVLMANFRNAVVAVKGFFKRGGCGDMSRSGAGGNDENTFFHGLRDLQDAASI